MDFLGKKLHLRLFNGKKRKYIAYCVQQGKKSSFATSMTNCVKCSPICYFMHRVGIHQVRILVFDNYQRVCIAFI